MATVLIDKLLSAAVKQGASDIHIVVGQPPVFRLHGRMRKLETKTLEADDTVQLMKSIAPERCQRELQETGSSDFGFAFGTLARFRVSIFKQRGDLAMVLRLIPSKLLSFEQIGLPEICRELVRRPRGLFLVTGPTGSGKTTTLATMIDFVNMTLDRHIVTMEDPIEYYHYHKKSVVNQREIGTDVHSFAEALRRVLRSDPDLILVEYTMPGMNGMVFVKTYHARGGGAPVLMLDDKADRAKIVAAQKAGVASFVLRPVDADVFAQHILQSLMKRKSA